MRGLADGDLEVLRPASSLFGTGPDARRAGLAEADVDRIVAGGAVTPR